MPWTVGYAPDSGMVVVTASGEVHDEDARAQTAEAIVLSKQHHATAILIDYWDALLEVSLARLYWLPDYAAELGAAWDTRVAVVLPQSRYRLDSYQFFELVCKNVGYHVNLFDTREAAQDWLAHPPLVPEQPAAVARA